MGEAGLKPTNRCGTAPSRWSPTSRHTGHEAKGDVRPQAIVAGLAADRRERRAWIRAPTLGQTSCSLGTDWFGSLRPDRGTPPHKSGVGAVSKAQPPWHGTPRSTTDAVVEAQSRAPRGRHQPVPSLADEELHEPMRPAQAEVRRIGADTDAPIRHLRATPIAAAPAAPANRPPQRSAI